MVDLQRRLFIEQQCWNNVVTKYESSPVISFPKISKEIGKAWRKSLTRVKGASLSLFSLALCFQPRSRPFV